MKDNDQKETISHITIKLKKDLYPLNAIQKSANAFKHLANIKIKNGKEYFIVSLIKVAPEVRKLIKNEFCNYVLVSINHEKFKNINSASK